MKKIRFASKLQYIQFPVIGKKVLPNWYKTMPQLKNGEKFYLDINGKSNSTFKKCMPFFDSMNMGYFVVLSQDIQVTQRNGVPYIHWPSDHEPVNIRESTHTSAESVPAGYSDKAWVWVNYFMIKLPRGHSMIICHPMNRYDLPFITMSGIVDADTAIHEGKVPFYLKENYEGVISAGTPIFQIIPFKRDNWTSLKDNSIIEEVNKNFYKLKTKLSGWYKNNAWHRKVFKDGVADEKN